MGCIQTKPHNACDPVSEQLKMGTFIENKTDMGILVGQ